MHGECGIGDGGVLEAYGSFEDLRVFLALWTQVALRIFLAYFLLLFESWLIYTRWQILAVQMVAKDRMIILQSMEYVWISSLGFRKSFRWYVKHFLATSGWLVYFFQSLSWMKWFLEKFIKVSSFYGFPFRFFFNWMYMLNYHCQIETGGFCGCISSEKGGDPHLEMQQLNLISMLKGWSSWGSRWTTGIFCLGGYENHLKVSGT